jgi:hypothetical protein
MTKVYLTFNFLFHDWHTPEGELWGIVQPHIVEESSSEQFPQLYTWISQSGDLTQSEFSFWNAGRCDTKHLVPVPFPDKCKLRVLLYTKDDELIGTPEQNDLSSFVVLKEPSIFSAANREPHQVQRVWTHRPKYEKASKDEQNLPLDESPQIARGSFSIAYNKQLRAAATKMSQKAKGEEEFHLERLPAMLQLAFWGGSRRRLPLTCVDSKSINQNLMQLSSAEDEKGIITTNLHSMLGLTFILGKKDQLGDLKTVTKLSVEVNGNELQLPDSAQGAWKELFGSLETDIDASTKLSIVSKDLSKRAYVRQAFHSFQNITNSSFFQMTSSRNVSPDCHGSAPASSTWAAPTRIVIRPSSRPSQNPLKWQAFKVFEGTLQRYRLAPIKSSGTDAGRTLLRFLPATNLAGEFQVFLKSNPEQAAGKSVWKDAVFLLDEGDKSKSKVNLEPKIISSDEQNTQADFLWIGSYELPWDTYGARTDDVFRQSLPAPTFLFTGKQPATPKVLLMFRVGTPFTTSFYQDDTQTNIGESKLRNSLGDRWELAKDENLPTSEFNVLQLISAEEPGIVPSLCFPGLVEFDFAQSAGAIEGDISVSYPSYVPPPESHKAEDAVLQELLNYNSLIVSTHGERLNPFGQILPYSTTMLKKDCAIMTGGGDQSFTFRFEPPTEAPARYEIQQGVLQFLPTMYREQTSLKTFFKELYDQLGQQRQLKYLVEHTLGVEIALDQSKTFGMPAYADFPVVLPTEVVLRRDTSAEGNKSQELCVDEDIPFLRVSFDFHSNETPLKLHFHTALLDNPCASLKVATNRDEARISAYRSLAELAFAASIKIKPTIYHFDYTAALAKSGVDTTTNTGSCLVAETGPEWDCTEELRSYCRNWLEQNTPIPEVLKCGHSNPLGTTHPNVLFVQFEILVERESGRVPPDDKSANWNLVWRPIPPDRSPAKEEANPNTEKHIFDEFQRFIMTLRSRCAVIPAFRTSDQEKYVSQAAAIIGPGVGAAAGWIFADVNLDPTSTTEVSTVFCPLAFSPLARDPSLGDDTFEIVNRYMETIESLINSDPAWADSNVTALRKNFESRVALTSQPHHVNVSDCQSSTTIRSVIDAVLSKLSIATKDEDKVDLVARPNATSELLPEIREQVARLLWASPRMFGDTKAFLCSLVQGGSLANPSDLFAEFVFFRSTKVSTTVNATGSPGKRFDSSPLSFAQALRTPTGKFGALRFIEVLDQARYGDKMTLSIAQWKGIRRLLMEGTKVEGQTKTLGVWENIPQAQLAFPNSAHAPASIYLPSREPIIPPSHIFSGYFEAFQSSPPSYTKLDITQLSQGEWAANNGANTFAEVVLLSPALHRSGRPDETFFSLLYWITGDESSHSLGASLDAVFSSLQNDEFLLYDSSTDWPSLSEPPQPDKSVFRDVLNAQAGSDLPAAFESANLCRLVQVITNKPGPLESSIPQSPAFQFKLGLSNKPPTVICLSQVGGKTIWRNLKSSDSYEVRMLRPFQGVGAHPGKQRLMLLITAKMNLWTPKSFRLVQRRNFEHFDKNFRQEAIAGGSPYAFQRDVARDYSTADEATTIRWRKQSLKSLVQGVLLPKCFPQEPKPKWNEYDLSVTVRRAHKTIMMVAASDGGGVIVKRDQSDDRKRISSYPLIEEDFGRGKTKPTVDDPICWFPEDTNDFLVDFQWSSPTNLQLLRLSGLRVVIASGAGGCERSGD